jgi:hypothetical protein
MSKPVVAGRIRSMDWNTVMLRIRNCGGAICPIVFDGPLYPEWAFFIERVCFHEPFTNQTNVF